MSDITEKRLFYLVEQNEELEAELEEANDIIRRALEYIQNNNMYIGAFNSYMQPIVDILTGKDKLKEKQKCVK
jgi:hypothetical protein